MITNWTTDPKEILVAVNALIEGQMRLTLLRTQAESCPTRAVGIHVFRGLPYLILHRPAAIRGGREINTALFKAEGLPILGFPCQIVKESSKLLATIMPRQIFQLELRQEGRFAPLPGSMVTFFLESRARINICRLDNISVSGAKLGGIQSKLIDQGDELGPFTLSLAGKNQLVSHELTLPLVTVSRTQQEPNKKGVDAGIQFTLGPEEERHLQEYLELLAPREPLS